jgi:hypothetical protein
MIQTKSERLRKNIELEYAEKNKEVKRKARRDKRTFTDQLAKAAEEAGARGDLSTLHKKQTDYAVPPSGEKQWFRI